MEYGDLFTHQTAHHCDTEYQAYLHNDVNQAFKCAFDKSLLHRNHVLPCYDTVEYEIEGEMPDCNQIQTELQITIESAFDFNLRLSKIIRKKLKLSSAAFKSLVEQGRIAQEGGVDLQKEKLKKRAIVIMR